MKNEIIAILSGVILVLFSFMLYADYNQDQQINLFEVFKSNEEKAQDLYQDAQQYYELELYDSAIIIYDLILDKYPETKAAESSESMKELSEIIIERRKLLDQFTK